MEVRAPYFHNAGYTIFNGDAGEVHQEWDLPLVHCVVTSPPYYKQRKYKAGPQEMGQEKTPDEYVDRLCSVLASVPLRPDGVLFLNLGDSYAGSGKGGGDNPLRSRMQLTNKGSQDIGDLGGEIPPGMKALDLMGIPWMVAFEMRRRGWYLRSDVIWWKRNPMPESVKGWRWRGDKLLKGAWRPTSSYEHIFMLTKSDSYYCDLEAISEPVTWVKRAHSSNNKDKRKKDEGIGNSKGLNAAAQDKYYEKVRKGEAKTKNIRNVWDIPTHGTGLAHYASYPIGLPERCVLVATSELGCCPVCGNQWARVNKTQTFRPTCTHNETPVASTVYDPFAGVLTTGLASVSNNRQFIGTELRADYIEMGLRRQIQRRMRV